MPTEPELIHALRRGEKRAFRDFYNRYAPVLLGLCIRYCGNRHDAEDVMHDAMIKIVSHLPGFEEKPSGSFEGWIKTIAVNTSINFLRIKASKSNWFMDDIADLTEREEDTDISQDFLQKIGHEEVLHMICELPEGYRTVFNLYVFEGKSHKEIAETCHCSESTSKSQLFKARNWLKNRILETTQIKSH